MTEFVKSGDKILVKPAGLDYDLIPGKIYDLKYDSWSEMSFLSENGELNLPDKIYEYSGDTEFMNRVLSYHKSSKKQTTGVLLSGKKGTGKSFLMKRIAKQSNLPIIVVSDDYPCRNLIKFFKSINTEVCILFDELEKNSRYWNSTDLLKFLDGVESTCKKLVMMTSNDTNNLDENLFDRCSRIRYFRKYEYSDNVELIKNVLKENNIDENIANYLCDIVEVPSIDNMLSIVEEINMFKDTSVEELLKTMNLTLKKDSNKINKNNSNVKVEKLPEMEI